MTHVLTAPLGRGLISTTYLYVAALHLLLLLPFLGGKGERRGLIYTTNLAAYLLLSLLSPGVRDSSTLLTNLHDSCTHYSPWGGGGGTHLPYLPSCITPALAVADSPYCLSFLLSIPAICKEYRLGIPYKAGCTTVGVLLPARPSLTIPDPLSSITAVL